MRWILVVALGVAMASPVMAAPGCQDGELRPAFGAGPLGHPRFAERIADRLELTPEQRDTLRGVVDSHRDAMQSLAAQHKDALCGFFLDASPDDADYAVSAATASQAAAALAAGSVDLVARLRTDFQAVLTDEQLAEWQVVREEIMERMAERMERRRNGKGERGNR